jgi:S1-C subfamily serine protease
MRTTIFPVLIVMAALVGGLLFYEPSPASPLAAASTVKVIMEDGHGSAVHLGKGRFLTAAHIAQTKAELTVIDDLGRRTPASLLWRNTDYDVALIKAPVANARSRELACVTAPIGTEVHASGSPGHFDNITTWGASLASR